MGTANGYASGMDASSPYTLEEAITKFAKRGGPPYGGGGMYDYLSGIAIYYGFDPDYIGSAEP
jgi:hypothetical protein